MIIKYIQAHIKNQRVKQVISLFSENILGIPISIITSIIITRYLGPTNYGDFQFINSIYEFAFIFISFGFFQAGSRALVLNENKEKAKEYYGAEFIITIGLFALLAAFLLFFAFIDNNIQEKQLRTFFVLTIPFGISFIILKYFETLLQADQRIDLLFIIRFYPRIGFLFSAGIIYLFLFNANYNKLIVVWSLFMISRLIVYSYALIKLNISFKNTKQRLSEIWYYNRTFGLNVYIGSVFALGLSRLTPILVSYFGQDNTGVGFLALASTFSLPLTFIPNTIATTHYKEFSKNKKIPKKVFLITLILSITALIGTWIIVGPFVNIAYGTEYYTVIRLTLIISIGYTAHGFADFFNRFLGANGQGKALRNSSIIVGVGSLLSSLLLIPKWGELGAAYIKLISGLVYLSIIYWYYCRYNK